MWQSGTIGGESSAVQDALCVFQIGHVSAVCAVLIVKWVPWCALYCTPCLLCHDFNRLHSCNSLTGLEHSVRGLQVVKTAEHLLQVPAGWPCIWVDSTQHGKLLPDASFARHLSWMENVSLLSEGDIRCREDARDGGEEHLQHTHGHADANIISCKSSACQLICHEVRVQLLSDQRVSHQAEQQADNVYVSA